jgi:hypothetical protein
MVDFPIYFPFVSDRRSRRIGLSPRKDKPLCKTHERTSNGICRITPESICIKWQAQFLNNAWPKESKNQRFVKGVKRLTF